MHPLLVILMIGVVIAGALYLMKPRPVFVVQLKDGQAITIQGKVAGYFLRECERIAAMYQLSDGRIEGCRAGQRVRLRFSKSIPQEYHQNFRNVWYAGKS